MASKFNCPHCGGVNEYAGESNTIRCQFCGSDVPAPTEMVNQVVQAKLLIFEKSMSQLIDPI